MPKITCMKNSDDGPVPPAEVSDRCKAAIKDTLRVRFPNFENDGSCLDAGNFAGHLAAALQNEPLLSGIFVCPETETRSRCVNQGIRRTYEIDGTHRVYLTFHSTQELGEEVSSLKVIISQRDQDHSEHVVNIKAAADKALDEKDSQLALLRTEVAELNVELAKAIQGADALQEDLQAEKHLAGLLGGEFFKRQLLEEEELSERGDVLATQYSTVQELEWASTLSLLSLPISTFESSRRQMQEIDHLKKLLVQQAEQQALKDHKIAALEASLTTLRGGEDGGRLRIEGDAAKACGITAPPLVLKGGRSESEESSSSVSSTASSTPVLVDNED